MSQVELGRGEDVANLAQLDRKHWVAMAMPAGGVRFDERTLKFLDSDGDGRIRTSEVLAAIDWLKSRNVDLESLFHPSEEDAKALDEVLARRAELAKAPLGREDAKALADWEAEGKTPAVAPFGEATAEGEAALAAVESVLDGYFATPDDLPLVVEEDDKTVPLGGRINPKYADAMKAFAEKCVKPAAGAETAVLDRALYKRIQAAFAPWRAHVASKPVPNAGLEAELDAEERTLRYKLHLLEFLENFVNMKRLYSRDGLAVFQTGVLRIDAKELKLCFEVADEAAHSALSGRSNCCVLYLKLARPSEGASRTICAVVTAGAVAGLYAGRNGVFYDRDGRDWDAVVTKVVESQVSLAEAFWAPWKKVGEAIGGMVKKFLGDRQTAAQANLAKGVQAAPAAAGATAAAPAGQDSQAGGAAMASSVAAIGIGIGMVGAAAASIMAAVSRMGALQIALAIAVLILAVSLPNVVLTWFKLRRRDIGAILNACGWAVNRPIYFSMKRARAFTKCAVDPVLCKVLAAMTAVLVVLAAVWWFSIRSRGA